MSGKIFTPQHKTFNNELVAKDSDKATSLKSLKNSVSQTQSTSKTKQIDVDAFSSALSKSLSTLTYIDKTQQVEMPTEQYIEKQKEFDANPEKRFEQYAEIIGFSKKEFDKFNAEDFVNNFFENKNNYKKLKGQLDTSSKNVQDDFDNKRSVLNELKKSSSSNQKYSLANISDLSFKIGDLPQELKGAIYGHSEAIFDRHKQDTIELDKIVRQQSGVDGLKGEFAVERQVEKIDPMAKLQRSVEFASAYANKIDTINESAFTGSVIDLSKDGFDYYMQNGIFAMKNLYKEAKAVPSSPEMFNSHNSITQSNIKTLNKLIESTKDVPADLDDYRHQLDAVLKISKYYLQNGENELADSLS